MNVGVYPRSCHRNGVCMVKTFFTTHNCYIKMISPKSKKKLQMLVSSIFIDVTFLHPNFAEKNKYTFSSLIEILQDLNLEGFFRDSTLRPKSLHRVSIFHYVWFLKCFFLGYLFHFVVW